MTDREADMIQHVTKLHGDVLKGLLNPKVYVKENACLGMTSI